MKPFAIFRISSIALFAGLCIFRAPLSAASRQDDQRPNIIYILADDLGYAELGCYGQTKIETPVLDGLAKEGMRFTQHYSGSNVCAPARYTLMTGKHVGRSDSYGQGQKLKVQTLTLAKILKDAGYATGGFGKWGLGKEEGAPNVQGFDEWYGFIDQGNAHFHYPLQIWENEKLTKIPENKGLRKKGTYGDTSKGVYIHDRFTEHALRFIDAQQDNPFFLYLPYTIPHTELVVPADSLAQYAGRWEEKPYKDNRGAKASGRKFYDGHAECNVKYPRATYAAMVSRMDRDIGRIVQQLKYLGIDKNTLVIFSSDNGPAKSGGGYDAEFFQGAGPLTGAKRSFYEGGLRVPMIARWPGKVAAGVVSDHISYFPDILPTCAELAGVPAPDDTDGISLLPALLGNAPQKEHEYLFWIHTRDAAVRMGEWKYIYGSGELYNLDKDLGEITNLADKNPAVVEKLDRIVESNSVTERFSKNPRTYVKPEKSP